MSRSLVAGVFAEEWPRVVATLVRDLGDLDLAEDAAQDAFVEAAARWGPDTTPDRPGAWLVTTARRKAIDRVRRDQRFADRLPDLHRAAVTEPPAAVDLVDHQLSLLFGCCHPALADDAQIALTLREVAGLSTGQIAHSFLIPEPTMAKRLVRAKAKIRAAKIPFDVPDRDHMADRLAAVLRVVYLIFTEGHTGSDAPSLVRGDVCDEARWLVGVLTGLLPEEAEVLGLAALLAFVDARRPARVDGAGRLVLLEDQDRGLWAHDTIVEGEALLRRATALGAVGPYQLQAAVAGAHSTAVVAADTDWREIVALYDRMLEMDPGPVVSLNRAIALAMVDGPAVGLEAIEELVEDGRLESFHYLHAARADLLRRMARPDEAAECYRRALELVTNDAERTFLEGRRQEVSPPGGDAGRSPGHWP